MNLYTRRRFIEDLALVSATGLACVPLGCKETQAAVQQPTTTNASLYLIVQGPWIISVSQANGQLHFLTAEPSTHPGMHKYSYFDPTSQSPVTYTINGNDDLHFAIERPTGSPAAPPASVLFNTIKMNGEGLFYDSANVTLKSHPPGPKMRRLSIDLPDQMLSAALMSNATFSYNSATSKQAVSSWPAAFVLIYHNWKSAALSNHSSNLDKMQPSSSITYRKFEVLRKHEDSPTPCDAAKEDAKHAQEYFGLLMKQLDFSGGASAPALSFDPCNKPVAVTIGGDQNVKCDMLDPQGYWCHKPIHGAAQAGALGPTLVNCASGHGGVVGCC